MFEPKRLCTALSITLLAACSSGGGSGDTEPDGGEQTDPDRLMALAETAAGPLDVRQVDGRVRTIRGRIPVDSGGDAESRGRSFLESWSDLFGLADVDSELGLVEVQTDQSGREVVIFERRVGNWRVFGSDVRLHLLPSDEISFVFANVPADVEVADSASLDETEALASAVGAFGLTTADVELFSSELVVFNPGVFHGGNTGSHLTWMVSFGIRDGLSDPVAFIDATDGQLRYVFDTVQSDRDRLTYNASNGTSRSRLMAGDRELWFNESGAVDGTTPSPQGQLAHEMAMRVHDYWSFTFGRDSYDSGGRAIETYVHFHTNGTNAYWAQNAMWFMEGMVALDIFGHEFAHGVISRTAELVYEGESGAINEHLADVFGVILDGDDWTVGEDAAAGSGVPGLVAFRSFIDPGGTTGWCGTLCEQLAQPDHSDDMQRLQVGGSCTTPAECGPTSCQDRGGACLDGCVAWSCQAGQCREIPNDCNDDGHVHSSSGILNHAAYLMIEPGVDTELRHEDGIGVIKLEQIVYQAMQSFLTSKATFDDFRDALLASCLAYPTFLAPLGIESYGITRTDCGVILNALHEVGVGAADSDFDAVDDDDDNCRLVANPEQQNADGDDFGDACDEDETPPVEQPTQCDAEANDFIYPTTAWELPAPCPANFTTTHVDPELGSRSVTLPFNAATYREDPLFHGWREGFGQACAYMSDDPRLLVTLSFDWQPCDIGPWGFEFENYQWWYLSPWTACTEPGEVFLDDDVYHPSEVRVNSSTRMAVARANIVADFSTDEWPTMHDDMLELTRGHLNAAESIAHPCP